MVDDASVIALPHDNCHSVWDTGTTKAADRAIALDVGLAVERRGSFTSLQNCFTIGLDEGGLTLPVSSLNKLGNGLIVEENREPFSVVADTLTDFDAHLDAQQ